jgi:hypothetical protein
VTGIGTAVATGRFHHSDRDLRSAVEQALDDDHPRNVIFFLGDLGG